MYKKRSLSKVVDRSIFIGAVFLLFASLIVETIIGIVPTLRFYKREMKNEGEFLVSLLGEDYIRECIKKTKDLYYSTPEEIRSNQYSDEYISRILPIIDDEYKSKRNIMSDLRVDSDLQDVFFTFYDKDMERLVYVLDGNDIDRAFIAGQWISDENGMIESFETITKTINSDWFMPLSFGIATGLVCSEYQGIYDEDGNLIGFLTINLIAKEVLNQVRVFVISCIPLLAILLFFVARRTRKWVKKRFLGPVTALTEKARRYNEISKLDSDRSQSVFEELSINTGDEIEELWQTMVDMEKDIAASISKIKEATAIKERLAAELDLANAIQAGALPINFEEFAAGDDFELYASMRPAKEVGGDFYDFFRIDETHIGLVIADVSDKGVPAALFMMTSKAILKGNTVPGRKPSEILRITNNNLYADNPNGMFLTAWLGIMDITTGEVVAANAGHEYPFITDANGNINLFEEPHGVFLGCLENMEYEDYVFTIPPGGILFVYTDGVAEAQNEAEELFGTDRIGKALNTFKSMSPKEMDEAMLSEIEKYSGNREQFDDITMLIVKR